MESKRTTKVSSAAFQRAFGRYRELAMRKPVAITTHGRESLILLSAEEYHRLKRLDRRALHPWEMSKEAIEALAVAEPPPEAAKYDNELKRRRR